MSQSLLADTTISHYRVLSPIGAGGMGEVYLAEDTRLDRKIALKILPEEVASDSKRMRRFIQEARLASSLSHPNICIIHEVGETEDHRPFIAMEYVSGRSLNEMIAARPLDTIEVLEIAAQIADALDEAHTKGIIHRDIKPANIIVTPRGQVKVLDFGLAKMTREEDDTPLADKTTRADTEPGLVMGTVQYMSPEQALGRDVDHRTDIFSLGVALYEMATGRRPFTGHSVTETIDNILHAQPEPVAQLNPTVPAELERIIKKALRKDRNERYQTAKDLLVDLRLLKQEIEFEKKADRSLSSGAMSGATAIITSSRAAADSTLQPARATSSIEVVTEQIKRHKVITLVLLALVIVAAAYGIYRLAGSGSDKSDSASGNRTGQPGQSQTTGPRFQASKTVKLTTSGNVVEAAISPDGRYVAYTTVEDDKQTLWVRQVASTSTLQLGPPEKNGYVFLTFSRDGNFLYYQVADQQSRTVWAYQVSVLGGPAKRVIREPFGPINFSPDGKQMIFARLNQEAREQELVVANPDGTNEQTLLSRKMSLCCIAMLPAWSPDGKTVAFAITDDDLGKTRLVAFDVASRLETPIPGAGWFLINRLEWLADGSGLILLAQARSAPDPQIWTVSYPEGEVRSVLGDLNRYESLSMTADSGAMVAVQTITVSNVWTASVEDAARAKAITSGTSKYHDLDWTPDGKILYASDASGSADIWVMDADGKNQNRLTAGEGNNYAPAASPDGRYVFFHSDRTGIYQIWRADADGGNPKQMTSGNTASNWPAPTPDGKWLLYAHEGRIYKMPVEGGEPVEVSGEYSSTPRVSPDGRMFACWQYLQNNGGVSVVSLETGQLVKQFHIPYQTSVGAAQYDWTGDSRGLVYYHFVNGAANIMLQPLDGGRPKQLTDFKSDKIFSVASSPDGKWLALSRGTITSDVILVTNNR